MSLADRRSHQASAPGVWHELQSTIDRSCPLVDANAWFAPGSLRSARVAVNAVLLLNATHEPLAVLSVARAAKLVFKQRVEAMVAEQATLMGNDGVLSVPSVLRLKVFVNVPRRNAPRWTRRGVFVRDGSMCAYCRKYLKASELTVDHVIPVSRGGRSTWGNTVTACARCNQRKADRMPHEAGMKLWIEPKTPRTNYLLAAGDIPATWKLWIEL